VGGSRCARGVERVPPGEAPAAGLAGNGAPQLGDAVRLRPRVLLATLTRRRTEPMGEPGP